MNIELSHISKTYGKNIVFADYSQTFETNKVHILMGPSGSGKTTLINMLMGFEKPDAGTITGMNNQTFSAVFQENRLLENITVYKNLMTINPKPSEKKLAEGLAAVGLSPSAHQIVSTLSGGEQRRVAILRALLLPSAVLFFDEAIQGLDEENKEKTMKYIQKKITGRTTFWITHDQSEIAYFPTAQVHYLE